MEQTHSGPSTFQWWIPRRLLAEREDPGTAHQSKIDEALPALKQAGYHNPFPSKSSFGEPSVLLLNTINRNTLSPQRMKEPGEACAPNRRLTVNRTRQFLIILAASRILPLTSDVRPLDRLTP